MTKKNLLGAQSMGRRTMAIAAGWVLIASALAACKSGSSSPSGSGAANSTPFGIESRVEVTTVRFPNAGAQPSTLTRVDAFPNLAFASPVHITSPRDGTNRLAVVERAGTIRIFANAAATASTNLFLDIRSRVLSSGGEEGLLGLAFDPQYSSNGWFYVYYTTGGPKRCVIARFQVSSGDPNAADAASERRLLEVPWPYSNHNGGMLLFGPDNMLYATLGDGGSGGDPFNNGQDLATLLGSILRIRPEADGSYSIPADNPFVGRGGGVREEIWAYGLRNPWRASFDRSRGDLWVGDVGQGSREEIDVVTRGANLGWRIYEGTLSHNNPQGLPLSSFTAPVYEYPRSDGVAVIGGYVYRGATLRSLQGVYLFGDNGSSAVWALTHQNFQSVTVTRVATVSGLSSFGEDEAGELFAVSLGGKIYRFTENSPPPTVFPTFLSETGIFTDTASLTTAPGVIEYALRHEHWVDGARMRRWIAVPGASQITFSAGEAWTLPLGTVLAKHFEIELRQGDPSSLKRLETRVLVHEEQGWAGYTYRWNAGGTEAEILPGAASEVLTVDLGGSTRSQTWSYPSRTDCFRCHTQAAGFTLGLRARQLNRNFDFSAATDNQLRTWNHIGLFSSDLGAASQYDTLAALSDTNATLEERARAYLDVNCAHCHLPNGPAPGGLDLRHETAVGSMSLVGVRPSAGDLGLTDAFRIKAGAKESSVLWERLRRTDTARMPPLATGVVDDEAVSVLGAWVDAMR